MGKTTLSHALAQVLGLSYKRVQFTSDLLPADILGLSIYHREDNSFRFHPGPIFTQVLLADEINRSTPRTQSALLEAMAEGQVTLEGRRGRCRIRSSSSPRRTRWSSPAPTHCRNPSWTAFSCASSWAIPPGAERDMLRNMGGRRRAPRWQQCIDPAQLAAIRARWTGARLRVAARLRAASGRAQRRGREFAVGLSPRGVLALLRSAKTWALMDDRDHVLPDDVQAVLPAVTAHRLQPGRRFPATAWRWWRCCSVMSTWSEGARATARPSHELRRDNASPGKRCAAALDRAGWIGASRVRRSRDPGSAPDIHLSLAHRVFLRPVSAGNARSRRSTTRTT
jgi:MoxR-like ATPase